MHLPLLLSLYKLCNQPRVKEPSLSSRLKNTKMCNFPSWTEDMMRRGEERNGEQPHRVSGPSHKDNYIYYFYYINYIYPTCEQ